MSLRTPEGMAELLDTSFARIDDGGGFGDGKVFDRERALIRVAQIIRDRDAEILREVERVCLPRSICVPYDTFVQMMRSLLNPEPKVPEWLVKSWNQPGIDQMWKVINEHMEPKK